MKMEDIVSSLPELLTGSGLEKEMQILPDYNSCIRELSATERLIALNDIYNIYIPSKMSYEIYAKLYLSCIKVLQKKSSKIMIQQRNANARAIKGNGFQGICGASDSFSIIGSSGIGKTSAITRSVNLFSGNRVIEIYEPFCKIIPCVSVQCPFDCSVKSLLLAVLMQIDSALDTHYYDMAIRARATVDMLIASVSQCCINHVGLLIVDEIQNVIRHKGGMQLIGCLTQLINCSGVAVCMVGTPEAEQFFMGIDYLARRSLGLRFDKCEYDTYFAEFCVTVFNYQYVRNQAVITDSIIHWLYEHSNGVLANVVMMIHDAQEMAVLNGNDTLDIESLENAYRQRMGMLHEHIRPSLTTNSGSSAVRKKKMKIKECENKTADDSEWSFVKLAEQAKKNKLDMAALLDGKVSVTEIAV